MTTASTATDPTYSQACWDGKHRYCGGLLLQFPCWCYCHRAVVPVVNVSCTCRTAAPCRQHGEVTG